LILFKFLVLGVLSALLFPPFFMLPLGFIIFPYLIKLLVDISIKKFFFNYFAFGFFYGLGFLLVFLSWIYNPFLINNETKNIAILGFILPIFLSLFFGIGFCIFKYLYNKFHIIIFTPFIFLLIEFIISNILYGFPWITYSLVLSNNIFGFYLLKYFGLNISSYLILFLFILPIVIIYSSDLAKKKNLILLNHAPFLIVFIFLFFISNLNNNENSKKIHIELFQILSPINKLDKVLVEDDIIDKINNSKAEYLIFAENNYPYLVSDLKNISIMKNLKNNQKVIIGTTRIENNRLYNSFIFLEKNNIQIFDKQILVPFGEFLPFRPYLKFMENITGNIDFTPGINKRLINSNNINLLPIVCYEIIFNKILKNINENKIDFLVNITNDSWFGTKLGPYQHFYHSRMRALIANKYLLRVSNNGITSITDNNGKILNFINLNKKGKLTRVIEIKNTFFYGSIHKLCFIYLIFIIFIYLIYIKYSFRNEK
tara:strand:+ start:8227 stop:9681 length:1455 start_codon:yes stop_codon:yes gene_type:complete